MFLLLLFFVGTEQTENRELKIRRVFTFDRLTILKTHMQHGTQRSADLSVSKVKKLNLNLNQVDLHNSIGSALIT